MSFSPSTVSVIDASLYFLRQDFTKILPQDLLHLLRRLRNDRAIRLKFVDTILPEKNGKRTNYGSYKSAIVFPLAS